MTYGISPTGFSRPILDDQKTLIKGKLKANIDAGLDVSDDGPIGQIASISADSDIEVWEAVEDVYGLLDPNKAEGVNLDNTCALTGTIRKARTKSEVPISLTLGASVTVPAGSQICNPSTPTIKFELVSDVTSVGSGSYAGVARAIDFGPVPANNATLTSIVTPVTGWSAVTNTSDATLGRLTETDAELRIRRLLELTQAGSAGADAIRAAVLEVDGVLQCKVYQNDSGVAYDYRGLPPKTFEVVIWDGAVPQAANADVHAAIYANKPIGESYGTTSTSTTYDASGNAIVTKFTRATSLRVYASISVTVDTATFDPVGGPAALKDFATAAAAQAEIGGVRPSNPLFAGLFFADPLAAPVGSIPGLKAVTASAVGTTGPGALTYINVDWHQMPTLDSADITINVSYI